MKKTTSIFFLLLLFGPISLSFLSIHFRKHQVKRAVKWEMIAGLEKQELVRLELSVEEVSSELKWKHSREFEYEGEMYDIVYIEAAKDSTVFHCWWDHEETALNQQLKSLLAIAFNEDPLKKDHQDRLSLFMKHLFCHVNEQELEAVSLNFIYPKRASVPATSPFLKLESPPPNT